jgi:outer membrane protein with beta-barrel domain
MKLSLRTLSASVLTLLAASVPASSAFAQETTTQPAPPRVASLSPAEPTPTPSAASPDQTAAPDGGCRDKWFAMGRCRDRKWTGPEIMLGADFGVSSMTETGPLGFGKGVGSATVAGPSWGVRAGVEVLPWLGLEGRYVGMYNSAQSSVSPAGSIGFLTTGGEAVLRLTAPLPFVHPYIFGGIGYYDIALTGSSTAQAGSVLHSSSQPGIPLGFGLDVPLTWYLAFDVEATYHFQLGEDYSAVRTNGIDGGDLTTFDAVLRARL